MTTIAHPELEGLERYKFGWADSDVAGATWALSGAFLRVASAALVAGAAGAVAAGAVSAASTGAAIRPTANRDTAIRFIVRDPPWAPCTRQRAAGLRQPGHAGLDGDGPFRD